MSCRRTLCDASRPRLHARTAATRGSSRVVPTKEKTTNAREATGRLALTAGRNVHALIVSTATPSKALPAASTRAEATWPSSETSTSITTVALPVAFEG